MTGFEPRTSGIGSNRSTNWATTTSLLVFLCNEILIWGLNRNDLAYYSQSLLKQKIETWAVVVAQLVEQSLPIIEVRGSNPVIGKKLYWIFTVNCIEKTKMKKKRPGMAHFLKNI